MAYPASQTMLKDALHVVDGVANRLKKQVEQLRNKTAAGNVKIAEVASLRDVINSNVAMWDAAVAGVNTAALIQYAKDEKGDQALDIVSEYQAMKSAAQALATWITNNLPGDEVTPAQTAPFRTNADSFLATIS